MLREPNTPSPLRRPTRLILWKQLKPLYVDRISLVASCGNILHHKNDLTARVTVRIHHFYKLSIVKNIQSGRTTSRQASPPGDGRGVPKCFQDFGKFSKLPLRIYQTFKPRQQQPSLLAGFALRRRLRLNVLRSYNQDKSMSIFLVKKGNNSVEAVIQADLSRMDPQNPSSALSLIDLIADANFDTKMSEHNIEPGFPEICSQDLDLYLDNPSLPPSTPLLEGCPIPGDNFLLNVIESLPAVVSVPTASTQTPINLRQTGPNSYEVIDPPTEPQPVLETESEEDQGYVSPPFSPPSYTASLLHTSSPSPPYTPSSSSLFEETREEKRLREQREACRKYRENRKRKREEEIQEIKSLETKNRELEKKVEVMKEIVVRMKETVMEVVTGKRKIKNEDEERDVKLRRT